MYLRALLPILLALPSPAFAQGSGESQGEPSELWEETDPDTTHDPEQDETIVVTGTSPLKSPPDNRGVTEVSRDDMDHRLPRSAPDALRFEPGVFVQKTAHGQGSAYIRGLTGQQTLILFDGIRLNNSTYRQGPNQYFFTLDSLSIQSIHVERGGASTRFGSDAIGGVIMASPIEPAIADSGNAGPVTWEPHLVVRGTTADRGLGGRVQTNLTLGESVAFFGGVGGRRVGALESGGQIHAPDGSGPPLVPSMARDGRTQLGTGFDELTADGRFVYRIDEGHELKLHGGLYRQYDAPRTDQCPAAHAPVDECLNYDEQFRSLVYGAWDGKPGIGLVSEFRLTLSWQNQHERRTLSRPSSFVRNTGRDDVHTFGFTALGQTKRFKKMFGKSVMDWVFRYGVDTYYDRVASKGWIGFTDIDYTEALPRGQYVDGSTYAYGGGFLEGELGLWRFLILRGGGRLSWIGASVPGVPEVGSAAVEKTWTPLVGHAGIELRGGQWIRFFANVDRSFRAPNLDDMTSRQQTGPGFQFENPALLPEVANTFEVGTRISALGPLAFELWAFKIRLHDGIVKTPMAISDCPAATPRCENSWSRFQLNNLAEPSEIEGVEAIVGLNLPGYLSTRLTLAFTQGEGPNPTDPPSDPSIPYNPTVPLSRIPPLSGTAEILWRHPEGLSLGAGLRFAATQDRLALSDISDQRIPRGGTPGFSVIDLRVSYRVPGLLLASLAFENVFDSAYRYHGSSVNGPARGLSLLIDLGPIF